MTAADLDWLRTHIGHEVKYMTYAAEQFLVRCNADDFGAVAMQDSTLTRVRSLLDFIRSGDAKNRHLAEFYASPEPVTWTPNEKALFEFVSRVLSHPGRDRDDPTGRWPGVGTGNGRNECLARVVLISLENRFPKVRTDYRDLLELMVTRAREYLDDPTTDRFHQMDPSNL
jgi:hypothetical protein